MSPSAGANGENGSHTPTAQMMTVIASSVRLGRLSTKGMRPVRITWTISVCDSSDSTNQPVWNSAWSLSPSNTHAITPKVT